MRLRKFGVTNYRSIQKTPRIAIGDNLTIVGPNNEGKSNLVRALVTALSALEEVASSRRRAFRRPGRRSIGLDYEWERDCPISLQSNQEAVTLFYLEFELDENDRADFHKEIGSNVNSYLPIEVVIGQDDEPDFEVKKQGKAKQYYRDNSDKIARFIGRRLSINHIPAIRTADEAEDVVRDLLSTAMRPLTRDPEYLRALEIIEEVNEPALRQLEGELTESLAQFLPSIRSVSLSPPRQMLRRAVSSVDIQIDDGQLTPLENKGDGVISLVSMALLARLSESTGASFNTILAIEEPESHLHPRAIHAIRDVLGDVGDDYQVIVTTHSPLLANRQAISANVIVKENNAVIARDISEIRAALGVRVSDNLSHARVIVVCEGPDDEKFLAQYVGAKNEDLKKASASGDLGFYPLGGAGNLPYVLTMLQQSVSAPVCFLDNDKSAREGAEKVIAEGLVGRDEIVYAKRIGLNESELEDIYDQNWVRELVLHDYKIDIQLLSPSVRKKKFSDRLRYAFSAQGKDFDKGTKAKVKASISAKAVELRRDAVNDQFGGPLFTLIRELQHKVLGQ